MATPVQRSALLAIACPWCSAAPGEVCSMPAPGSSRRDAAGGVRRATRVGISTLDGGCHDARWQAAGLGPAPVLAAAVDELRGPELRRVQERQLVAAGPVDEDRPW